VSESRARFAVGELVTHQLFDYRGVVFDVDPVFMGNDEWYEQVARSRPPRDRPWYHVLVHGAQHTTYVAERNLEPDDSSDPIDHFFHGFEDGRYLARKTVN
jgi:heat shock protein HspQ